MYEVSAWLLAVLIVSVVYVTYTYMKFMWCDIHIHDVPASVLAVMIVNVIFIICVCINVWSIRLIACSADFRCSICDIYIYEVFVICDIYIHDVPASVLAVLIVNVMNMICICINVCSIRLRACSAECKCGICDIYIYEVYVVCDIYIHDVPASVLAVMIVNEVSMISTCVNVCSIRLRACSADFKVWYTWQIHIYKYIYEVDLICDINMHDVPASVLAVLVVNVMNMICICMNVWSTRLSACSADFQCIIPDKYIHEVYVICDIYMYKISASVLAVLIVNVMFIICTYMKYLPQCLQFWW